jgi:hypothetical protein
MTHLNRGLAGVALAVSACVASATPILAQEASAPGNGPIVLLDLHGGAPSRLSGGATVLFPFGKASSDDNLRKQNAMELEASAGMGGARLAGGIAFLTGPFGPDVQVSLTHTSTSPRGFAAHATYAGLDAGYLWFILRVRAGIARRVAAPSGEKATLFTWQAGVQVPLCAIVRRR